MYGHLHSFIFLPNFRPLLRLLFTYQASTCSLLTLPTEIKLDIIAILEAECFPSFIMLCRTCWVFHNIIPHIDWTNSIELRRQIWRTVGIESMCPELFAKGCFPCYSCFKLLNPTHFEDVWVDFYCAFGGSL